MSPIPDDELLEIVKKYQNELPSLIESNDISTMKEFRLFLMAIIINDQEINNIIKEVLEVIDRIVPREIVPREEQQTENYSGNFISPIDQPDMSETNRNKKGTCIIL